MAASGDFTSFPKICEAGSQVAASTTKTNQGKAKTQLRFNGLIGYFDQIYPGLGLPVQFKSMAASGDFTPFPKIFEAGN